MLCLILVYAKFSSKDMKNKIVVILLNIVVFIVFMAVYFIPKFWKLSKVICVLIVIINMGIVLYIAKKLSQ